MSDYSKMPWPVVGVGDRGPLVKAAQRLLVAEGAKLEIDGTFGSATKKAIENHQKRRNLSVDGQLGKKTWPTLVPVLKRNDRGEAVLAAQELMGNDGGVDFDGIFGAKTEAAVRATQGTAPGTKLDGILGHQTWSILLSMFDRT